MASKYDEYWLTHMEEFHNGIVKSMKTGRSIYIDVHDITAYGKRDSAGWYGIVELPSKGIKKVGMAHARSLGSMVMIQDFF